MYSLAAFGEMTTDRVRVDAYAQALRKCVLPGSVVLEIGTGPGIFAVLACELGARRVYAVESGDIIQVAREVAAANGCADRIVFIEGMSTNMDLPEKADILVSDLRGVLPLFQNHIPSIMDARARHLLPGAILIPRKDTIWAAIVEAPESYREMVGPWEENILAQDLSAGRRLVVNECVKKRLNRDQLLTSPEQWAVLDYPTIECADVHHDLHWDVERSGTGHGLIAWFDAELIDGVRFSNAPGAPATIYGSLFFPWPQPVTLAAGQRVTVNLEARLVEANYVWRWQTCVESANAKDREIARFDQSNLASVAISPQKLARMASSHVPQLSEAGALERRILELFDGHATLEEIARRLAEEYPKKFARWQDALTAVGAASQKYGK